MSRIHTPWDDARELTEVQLREQVAHMAVRRVQGRRTRRELAFTDVLHQLHPQMCRCPARYTPHWLHERNEDPYGTPALHPFWDGVSFEKIGQWKIFERDGAWYAFKTSQNAWSAARPTRDDAVAMATAPSADVWA